MTNPTPARTLPPPLSTMFGVPTTPAPTLADPTAIEITGRGRLLGLTDISAMLHGRRTVRWIKGNVARGAHMLIGKDWYWWEIDVRAWFDQQRGAKRPALRGALLTKHKMRALLSANLESQGR